MVVKVLQLPLELKWRESPPRCCELCHVDRAWGGNGMPIQGKLLLKHLLAKCFKSYLGFFSLPFMLQKVIPSQL